MYAWFILLNLIYGLVERVFATRCAVSLLQWLGLCTSTNIRWRFLYHFYLRLRASYFLLMILLLRFASDLIFYTSQLQLFIQNLVHRIQRILFQSYIHTSALLQAFVQVLIFSFLCIYIIPTICLSQRKHQRLFTFFAHLWWTKLFCFSLLLKVQWFNFDFKSIGYSLHQLHICQLFHTFVEFTHFLKAVVFTYFPDELIIFDDCLLGHFIGVVLSENNIFSGIE